MTQIYHAAKFYVDELKLSVVPIVNGQKRPAVPWTRYQERKPDDGELAEWFYDNTHQIGVVCGAVSGGLVVLDFETPGAYNEWRGRHSDLASSTRTVQTGKGFHVYILLPPDEVRGNQKLVPDLVKREPRVGRFSHLPHSIQAGAGIAYTVRCAQLQGRRGQR